MIMTFFYFLFSMNTYVVIALVAAIGAVLAASTITVTLASQEESVVRSVGNNRQYMDYQDGIFKVKAGAGGPTAPLTAYFPQVATIKSGESVVWYNPSNVGEPHTVTFVLDGSYGADFAAPFIAKNVEGFESLVPNGNAEPITFPSPEGETVIVAANARAISPTVVSDDGSATYLPPNAEYVMDGTEKYINSGFIWPEGMSPPGFPEVSTFSVTFAEPGTYDYFCLLHPWQAGKVVVQ
jgi:plastocyanin